jgi:hypothetical protein
MASKKSLYMETTDIHPSRTAGEIVSELVAAGASSVNTEYKDGKIAGLRWVMRVHGVEVLFDMPTRVEPVYQFLLARRELNNHAVSTQEKAKLHEKAERIAWRQLLRWVQAQNAMIDTGMVQAAEVYLAYMVDKSTNRTLFEHMVTSGFKQLGAAN